MDDRGEKIVSLARTMLQAQPDVTNIRTNPPSSVPLGALCLTAFLAAFGASAITDMANEQHRPVNRYERVEIEALMSYAAMKNNTTPNAIRDEIVRIVASASFNDMTVSDYSHIRDYLRERISSHELSR